MAYDFQVVIDSADAHAQADWWAETLGWDVEPQDEEFIRSMIAQGYAQESDTRTHKGRLVWHDVAINSPDKARRVLFQRVPEAIPEPATDGSVPERRRNRLHLDIRIGDDDREEVVAKLTARGATRLWEGRQGPHRWVTMADPEGNEFCVAESPAT